MLATVLELAYKHIKKSPISLSFWKVNTVLLCTMPPHNCVNHKTSFCYICGECTLKSQKRNITPLVKKSHELYFRWKVGDPIEILGPLIFAVCCVWHCWTAGWRVPICSPRKKTLCSTMMSLTIGTSIHQHILLYVLHTWWNHMQIFNFAEQYGLWEIPMACLRRPKSSSFAP